MVTKAKIVTKEVRTASIMAEVGDMTVLPNTFEILKKLEMDTCTTCPW